MRCRNWPNFVRCWATLAITLYPITPYIENILPKDGALLSRACGCLPSGLALTVRPIARIATHLSLESLYWCARVEKGVQPPPITSSTCQGHVQPSRDAQSTGDLEHQHRRRLAGRRGLLPRLGHGPRGRGGRREGDLEARLGRAPRGPGVAQGSARDLR